MRTLLFLLGFSGCRAPLPAPVERPSVVLVVVDTLRADRLGIHGQDRPTTPALDAFARKSRVYEQARATSSWTLPSLASLFTGRPPRDHGVGRWEVRFSDALPTLAEVFQQGGYTTAAVVAHHALLPEFGFDRGFATYDTSALAAGAPSQASTAPLVAERALELLDRLGSQPFFLWLHFFDPHAEYQSHEGCPWTGSASDRYDCEVQWVDRHLAPVLERLDRPDLASRTVVAFTADHGEEFLDHRGTGHGHSLYEELVRVPLVVRIPWERPSRVTGPVSHLSLGPTLLDLAHLPRPPSFDAPPLDGVPRDGAFFLETRQRSDLAALVRDPWKCVWDRRSGRMALFHLASDPTESADLAAREPDRVAACRADLEAFYAADPRADTPPTLSPAAEGALRELGYR